MVSNAATETQSPAALIPSHVELKCSSQVPRVQKIMQKISHVCCKQPYVNMIDYFQAQRHLVLTLPAVFPKLKEQIASVLISFVCVK